MANVHKDAEYVLLSKEQIATRVKEIAKVLDEEYQGKNPVLICILKGSVVFFSDLIREMETDLAIDFMKVSSYGNGTETSGTLTVKQDLSEDIANRHVLIVEDIIDSGNTLFRLKNMLQERNPASVKIVTLLDKKARRTAAIDPDYTCFDIADEFVIGYGLDYAEKYRNLPYVGVLKRSVYEK